jgi:hypothetical protein
LTEADVNSLIDDWLVANQGVLEDKIDYRIREYMRAHPVSGAAGGGESRGGLLTIPVLSVLASMV